MALPIDTARTAMLRQQRYLETVAHNISNVDTPGFKATYAALESGELPAPGNTSTAADGSGAPLSAQLETNRRFSQGPIRDTGVPTDMAIDGDGFFVLQAADGTTSYTRNGSFRLDSSGRITDAAGRSLQPELVMPTGSGDLRVAPDGTVSAFVPGSAARQTLGRLQLATFPNANGLLEGADGSFSPTAASGRAQTAAPGQDLAGTVRSGALEGANTDVTEEMTNLLAAQRLYQLNTSAFRMADELQGMSDQLASGG
jgi:flagellar basal-body rod protein FlgG